MKVVRPCSHKNFAVRGGVGGYDAGEGGSEIPGREWSCILELTKINSRRKLVERGGKDSRRGAPFKHCCYAHTHRDRGGEQPSRIWFIGKRGRTYTIGGNLG